MLAAILRMALDPILGEDLPLFLFVVPIIVAGWSGGLWPGLLATVLSLLFGDYLFIAPRGSIFHYETTLNLTRAVALAFTGTGFSILFEKTRKAIQAQLECMERFRLLVESAKDYAIFTLDAKGRVDCWNTGAERIAGYGEGEVIGHDFSMLYPPEDVEIGKPRLDLETAAEGRCEEEGWQTRKDGSRFWASGVITPLRDHQGRLRGFAKITRDMTARKLADEALRESQRFAQHIVDVCPTVICIYDVQQSKNTFVSRGIAAALGYSPEQDSQNTEFIPSVMHPDDWQPFLDHLRQVAGSRDEETLEFEYRLRHSNGAWRWFHCHDKVFTRNEVGDVREIIGTATDITDRKNAEDRTRFLADLNEALLPLADPDQIMAVAVRMLGEYLDVDRCGYADVLRDEDQFVVRGDYTRSGTPSIVGIYRMSEFGENEQEILRQDRPYVVNDIEAEAPAGADLDLYRRGQIRSLVCVPLRKGGNFVARMAVQQNTPRHWSSEEIQLITTVANRCWESVERARAVRNLKESEERFARAFQTSPDAMLISRIADGAILEVNDSFVSLSGYDRDQLIGNTTVLLGLYVDPADRERAVALLKEHNWIRDFEFRMKRKSGEVRTILFSAEPLDLHGEHCWLAIGRDITERKRAEEEREQLLLQQKEALQEAEAANQMKDEFLATISHELRTPLTAIMGWAAMLTSESLSESQRRHALQVIEQSAKSQARLVDDILDASRIITGRFKLEVQAVDIERVFRAAIDVIRPTADAKRIALRVMIDDGGSIIRGDCNRLQQVIWNLLSNAVKFTNEGGSIDARLTRSPGQIEISVTDNGIGIEPQFMPYIFDRFRQADSTSTRRYGGLGLGLAIVRHVVEMHGGSVFAASAGKGRGATFTIRFPAASPALPVEEPAAHPASDLKPAVERRPPQKVQRLVGVRLLVVEDDPDTLYLLRFILTESGAEVNTAASTREALKILEHWRPDVLISDLAMPYQDGYELIAQVRSRTAEQGRNIPAIALSSYTRPEDRVRAVAAGFQMHVSKPVDPGELVGIIASLCEAS